MKRLPIILLLIVLVVGFCPAALAGAPAPGADLTILFTHDLHSHLVPYRAAGGDGNVQEIGGYARLARLAQDRRAAAGQRTLLVDAGDFSMGTLFHTLVETHPVELKTMAMMGYDAVSLGNHEFEWGSQSLARMLAAAKAGGDPLPPVTLANATFTQSAGSGGGLAQAFVDFDVRDYLVLERGGLRIGLFGLLGKDASEDIAFIHDVQFGDTVETARRVVKILREREKVDVVVALSHSGTWPEKSRSEDEILARQVPGIDVIVSGHTHTYLAQPIMVGHTAIVSAGAYGANLGELRLAIDGPGATRVTGYALYPITARLPEDPGIAAAIAGYQAQVDRDVLAPYGLHYGQALARAGFNLESLDQLAGQSSDSGLGNMIADAFRAEVARAEGSRYDYVQLVLEPHGSIRASVTAGPVTVANVFSVLALGRGPDGIAGYPLVSFYLTGAEIARALEVQTTLAPLKDDYSLEPSGIRLSYNPRRVPFDRVTAVDVEGSDGSYRPIEPGHLYRVVVNYQVALLLDTIGSKSHGIIDVKPKDRSGQPVKDLQALIIDSDPTVPGVQEIKEWSALAHYLASQPDTDGDGLPDVPERYRAGSGRIVVRSSWSLVALLGGATSITFIVLGTALLVLALVVALCWWLSRLIRRRRARQF